MNFHRTIALAGAAFCTLTMSSVAWAQQGPSQYGQGDLGLGLMVGSPTGLSAKQYIGENHAVDGALGFGYGGMHIHADYIFEQKDFLGESEARLGWFIGLGAQLQTERNRYGYYNHRYYGDERGDRHYHLGARVPLGLELRFQSIRQFEFFGELALGLEIVEYPGPTLDAAIGTRFYF